MSTTESSQSHSRVLRQTAIGALLIHGLNGTPEEMAEMETFLQANGIITENILLPGHGVPVREMASLGWEDWANAVRRELRLLKQRCEYVFLVGHSLGGALALHVAAHEEVTGIVTMCAPLHMYPGLKRLVGIVSRINPMLPRLHDDVRDPGARRRYNRNVYRLAPVAPVYSMLQFLPQLRGELPRITVPILIMTAINDHVVPARDGREIYRLIGSHDKHLLTLHRSYHMIMMDHDREEVFAKTSAFILRHAQTMSCRRAQLMTTAFRSFFRFLFQKGELQVDLAASVPRVADWRLSTVPKHLTREEVNRVRAEHDPIDQARQRLLDGGTTEAALKEIDGAVRGLVAEAAQFAQDCPEPDPAELWTDVWAEA